MTYHSFDPSVPSPIRPLDDIQTTGAGWITDAELDAICNELRAFRHHHPGAHDLLIRLSNQSGTISTLRDENDKLLLDLSTQLFRKEALAALSLLLTFAILLLLLTSGILK